MRLNFLSALLLGGSFVNSQVTYPNLAIPFLQTSNPVTPLPNGFPWGTRTANNTNPYPPNTGVIRAYDFTISRGTAAPDGYQKDVLLINNQFPGPLIEANWGDTIQVKVTNQITGPEEGVALHWHGILQKTSQWMDGVPAVSQCPIPPTGFNNTFTYSFVADLYGTTWYHSHYSAQYAGGLIGPLVVHGPTTVPYDIDIGPVLLTDYYHKDYLSLVEVVMSNGVPASDNNLINGKNNFNCSDVAPGDTTPCTNNAGTASFKFTAGKKHRLRLINAGAEGIQKFSIDGHNMTVIANDFVPIIPYQTQVVTLGIGQRTDIIVQGLSHPTGSYTMRSYIPSDGLDCSVTNIPNVSSNVTATVYYSQLTTPNTSPWPAYEEALFVCQNDNLTETVPWYPITPTPNPATTKQIDIDFQQNATGHFLFTMNNSSFRANYNNPILLLSKTGNDSYPYDPEWNVYNFGSNSSIRIVINNLGAVRLTHPMHLHGHNFFVESVGAGAWDGTIVNPSNPQRRDVQLLPGGTNGGHLVLQIAADNPGAWPLHCHIAWHVSAGLYVTVLERPADIQNLPIPSIMAQTCRDWAKFTNTTIIDQIDSGL